MPTVRQTQWLTLLGASIIAGCVHAKQAGQLERSASSEGCIRVADLAEWQPLSEGSILLSAPGERRGYLITLATPIEDLPGANDLEIIDGDLDGFICAGGIDQVYAAECFCASASIAAIEYLSEKRTAELLGEEPTIL